VSVRDTCLGGCAGYQGRDAAFEIPLNQMNVAEALKVMRDPEAVAGGHTKKRNQKARS